MHLYHILINWSQKFWVVYVCYRFILEQCENTVIKDFLQLNLTLSDTLEGWIIYSVLKLDSKNAKSDYVSYPFDFLRHALTLKILMDKDSFCFVFIALICIAILKLVDMICDQRTS